MSRVIDTSAPTSFYCALIDDDGLSFKEQKAFDFIKECGYHPIEDGFGWYNFPGPLDQRGNEIVKRGAEFYNINSKYRIVLFSETGEPLGEVNSLATKFCRNFMSCLKEEGNKHEGEEVEVKSEMLLLRRDMKPFTQNDCKYISSMIEFIRKK